MGTLRLLDPVTSRELTQLPYSYPEVGATDHDQLPVGYRHLRLETVLGHGADVFDRISEALLSWQLHTEAGLGIEASERVVGPETVVIATLRLGLPIRTRCRVAYLIEEERRRGFAYGTLPGHPERGEERFDVSWHDDDRVTFGLTAFAQNASALARIGGPISRRVQLMVNRRYLAAARRTAGVRQ